LALKIAGFDTAVKWVVGDGEVRGCRTMSTLSLISSSVKKMLLALIDECVRSPERDEDSQIIRRAHQSSSPEVEVCQEETCSTGESS